MKDSAIADLVLSVDSLHGSDIDTRMYGPWRNVPPIPKTKILKGMCRKGISPSLRSAIWIISIVRNTRDNNSNNNINNSSSSKDKNNSINNVDEYGTLGKVNELQRSWEKAILKAFPNENDEIYSNIPRFGLGKVDMKEVLLCHNYNNLNEDVMLEDVSEMGVNTLKRVLIAVYDATGVECCHLIPDISNVLLSHMSESQVFFAVTRMMKHDSSKSDSNVTYVPCSKMEHYMWCKTFCDIMVQKHSKLAKKLEMIGVLCPRGLDPIFKRFFVQLLKREHILRLMDVFVIDGSKILFRLGVTLVVMFEAAGLHDHSIDNALTYWNGVTSYVHQDKFNFETLLTRSLGTKKLLRKFIFPTRRRLENLMQSNETWANSQSTEDTADNKEQSVHKPIPYVGNNKELTCKLVVPGEHRMNIRRWIPDVLLDTKLGLVFSTDIHGRSLETLYSKLNHVQCSLFLIEVLQTGDIIGMFAAKPIKRNLIHTAGECFLFSLTPNANCFQWNSQIRTTTDTNNDLSLVVKDDFIAMGINKNGSCALRINEDLTEGESYASDIYKNTPLAGEEWKDFEIGLVEVYQFIRSVDNKPVGTTKIMELLNAATG